MMVTKTYWLRQSEAQVKMFYRQDPSDNFSLSEGVAEDHFLRFVGSIRKSS